MHKIDQLAAWLSNLPPVDEFEERVTYLSSYQERFSSLSPEDLTTWLVRRIHEDVQREASLALLGMLAQNELVARSALLNLAVRRSASYESDSRWEVCQALAALPSAPGVLDALLQFVDDPDPDIRWQATLGLPDQAEGGQPGAAEEALVHLMGDDDDEVRDWATMGLGSILTTDSEAIRDALNEALKDPSGDVRAEAALGLAKRGDPRAVPLILENVTLPDPGNLWVEAALALDTPELREGLRQLAQRGWKDPAERVKLALD